MLDHIMLRPNGSPNSWERIFPHQYSVLISHLGTGSLCDGAMVIDDASS
jgi:hypothetical protein